MSAIVQQCREQSAIACQGNGIRGRGCGDNLRPVFYRLGRLNTRRRRFRYRHGLRSPPRLTRRTTRGHTERDTRPGGQAPDKNRITCDTILISASPLDLTEAPIRARRPRPVLKHQIRRQRSAIAAVCHEFLEDTNGNAQALPREIRGCPFQSCRDPRWYRHACETRACSIRSPAGISVGYALLKHARQNESFFIPVASTIPSIVWNFSVSTPKKLRISSTELFAPINFPFSAAYQYRNSSY